MQGYKTYLNIIDLLQLDNWSVQALLDSTFNYSNKFDLARIGDFLLKSREIVDVEDDEFYNRVTIRINNKGVELRDTEKGINIGTKKQYRAKAGQFIISKIDARNGALGIIPEELDNAIVTNDFPLFDVDQRKINPQFLLLITTTREFIKFAQSCSSGTTNRQRMDIEMFLNQKIPLPSISDQNIIVNTYYDKLYQAQALEQEANDLEQRKRNYMLKKLYVGKEIEKKQYSGLKTIQFSSLTRWALSHAIKLGSLNFENCPFSFLPVKSILKSFEGGKTPSKNRRDFWNGDIPWASPKDFKGPSLFSTEDKITLTAVTETGIRIFPKGTLLSVFRSGILRHSFPTLITEIETTINQDVKAYTLNEAIIDKHYYLYFVDVFRDYLLNKASKKSVTVESINTEEFMDVLLPVPPMTIQKELVIEIEKIIDLRNNKLLLAANNRGALEMEFDQAIFSVQ